MSVLDRADTKARLFIGLPVPETVCGALQEAARRHYGTYFDQMVPPEKLHVTLFFFGEVLNHGQYVSRLKQPLLQTFVPTVSVTHLGRGEARDQLWAYVTPTPALENLRAAVDERLHKIRFPRPVLSKRFIPHIRLASFFPAVRGMGIADTPLTAAYAVREVYLYSSEVTHAGSTYSIEAAIRL